MSPEIAAALISGGFIVLVALIEKSRRDNNRDHNQNTIKLDRIENKLDNHIDNHDRGGG